MTVTDHPDSIMGNTPEGLQVRVRSPRKRAGISSVPPVEADAPNVVWVIDF